MTWNSPQKGIDDFIVAYGETAFNALYESRQPFSHFKLLDLLDLSRLVSLTITERHLPKDLIAPSDAIIIGIKSPKNTGKTAWLALQVQLALQQGRRVIVITHRIQLARDLCNRFGIAHIEEIKEPGKDATIGFALCIDSLHRDSKAQFDPEDWKGASIIIDEAEQVFWHALSSHTMREKRTSVLETLEQLLKIALSSGGKLYLADADLSPIAIHYAQQLAGVGLDRTWIVQNICNPNQGKRKLYVYRQSDPKVLVADLIAAVQKGQRALIHTSGQKEQSTWGTINLQG